MHNEELYDFFQSGFYECFWRWEFNDNESQDIAEKSIKLLGINSGHILDWCGGWGRISFYLAKRGFKITILDFNKKYLLQAKQKFNENNLELITIQADCRKTPENIHADNAICTFSSIGFLDDNEQVKAFKSLYNALKTSGKIIVDCINQLFIAKHFGPIMERTKPDGTKCIKRNNFDLRNSILYSDFQIMDKSDNLIGKKSISQRLYTPLELEKILETSGFKVVKMYGNFEGEDLSVDLPQIVVIAEK